ncbi:MAG: TetR/AcrR family transcriptional regulator [Candidatus Cloacimonadaceae bacterium]
MNQAENKKQIILDIATRVFSKYGYSKTFLNDIADEASIAKGTIYYYFKNKQELFLNVVATQAQTFVSEIRRQLKEQKGFENKLRFFILAPIKYICNDMQVWLEGLHNLPFNYGGEFEDFHQKISVNMLEILEEIVSEGIAEDMIAKDIPHDRLLEVINDWFLVGNAPLMFTDFDALLKRIERDHEIIVQLIMYGIVKRG